MFEKFNVERKSRMIIGILAVISILMYAAFTLGESLWVLRFMAIVGILAGLFMWSEGSIVNYFKTGKYKSFSVGDIMVIALFVVGAVFIINSLSLLSILNEVIPAGFLAWIKGTTLVTSVIGIILIIVTMFTPKFE